jgi:hypothetical protein
MRLGALTAETVGEQVCDVGKDVRAGIDIDVSQVVDATANADTVVACLTAGATFCPVANDPALGERECGIRAIPGAAALAIAAVAAAIRSSTTGSAIGEHESGSNGKCTSQVIGEAAAESIASVAA